MIVLWHRKSSGGGKLEFDKCLATPAMMPRLSKVSICLMVSTDVAKSLCHCMPNCVILASG